MDSADFLRLSEIWNDLGVWRLVRDHGFSNIRALPLHAFWKHDYRTERYSKPSCSRTLTLMSSYSTKLSSWWLPRMAKVTPLTMQRSFTSGFTMIPTSLNVSRACTTQSWAWETGKKLHRKNVGLCLECMVYHFLNTHSA